MAKDDNIIEQLTKLELDLLPLLTKESSLRKIGKISELKDIQIQRAAQWLSNKELLILEKKTTDFIDLEENGKRYVIEGLPEKQLLKILMTGPKSRIEILKSMSNEELNVSIGLLKKQGAITIENKDNNLIFSITKSGKIIKDVKTPIELFLKKDFPIQEANLGVDEKTILPQLTSRKGIIKKEKRTEWTAKLTKEGIQIANQAESISKDYVEKLTPKMLKDKSWKDKKFRAFDINSKVPKLTRGRKHFVNEAIEYIKQIWLELGFEEMQTNYVQSAFWDLDALFVPQDHPAREEQDTFYLNGKAKLPKNIYSKISKVHENGGDTGSKGWQTKYDKNIAEEILLRTHTTVTSARTLSKLKKEDLPKKFFVVGRLFRNESLDWKHLFEFNQVEGIVVDPNANFAQLLGYLKEFFKKMGYSDVRIRPAHFPYTEPSAEIEVFHPIKKEWVEMGGSGIFRPEVTKTLLGFECPVLAWGLGMERIISTYYEIQDIREIYSNDLEKLKSTKTFLR